MIKIIKIQLCSTDHKLCMKEEMKMKFKSMSKMLNQITIKVSNKVSNRAKIKVLLINLLKKIL